MPQIPVHPPGPGIEGWEIVSVEAIFNPGEAKLVLADCPAGKRVLGGGYFPKDQQGFIDIKGSWPSDKTGSALSVDGTAWAVYGNAATNFVPPPPASIIVYAICADVQPSAIVPPDAPLQDE